MTQRDVVLPGALNVRDLGGLSTVEGRRVRSGAVLRAATLAELTEESVATLHGRCLRTVVDLRGAAEVARDGRGLLADSPAVAFRNLPVVGARSVRLDQAKDLDTGSLLAHYVAYLETSADVVIQVLRLLADPAAVPAVVHCAAGKDRTGVVVAVLLEALGVERAQVVADYAATEANMPLVRVQLTGSASTRELGAVPDWVLTALPETMEGLLGYLDTQGGTVSWLHANGFTGDELDRLRSTLLE